MLSFSGWNMFGTLGHMFKDLGVNLILNFFFGPIVNAARGVANQVNSGLQSFVSNITVPVRPQLIQSYSQGNINRSLNLTYTMSKLSCFVLLLMAVPIMLEIDYILHIWLGDKNIPAHTASFVIIIVLNSFLNNLNSAISGLVHASGKMKKYQLAGGSISLISVIIVYFSMLFMEVPELALIVILIMDTIRQIIALIILKSIVPEFSFGVYTKNIILPLSKVSVVGIIIPICIHCLLPYGLLRFITVFIISIFLIGFSIYFLGLNCNEKILVKNIFDKLKSKLK
jgi:O-antigen/teichoic acid export membrane protein